MQEICKAVLGLDLPKEKNIKFVLPVQVEKVKVN